MIKKDLPTLLKLRAEHNLDDKWFIDRVEEYMLEVLGDEGEYGNQGAISYTAKEQLLKEQRQRLAVLLGKGEKNDK